MRLYQYILNTNCFCVILLRSSQKKTSVPASDVVRSPVADDVVRPSPAGTREPEIIPASNLK